MHTILIPLLLFMMRWCTICGDDVTIHEPRLMSSATFINATVGANVEFPCDVQNLGDFIMIWKRDFNNVLFAGRMRVINDNRISVESSSLHIASVQPKDSGEYTCQISTNPPLGVTHTLDVLSPPSLPRPQEDSITVKEGDSITLTCDAEGNPMPTITWKHAGRHYKSSEKNSYIIMNARKNDSGEYECIADNSVGQPTSAAITVEIKYSPSVRPEEAYITAMEGDTIILTCDAEGNPVPTITWKRAGHDYDSTEENSYIITSAQKSDHGEYECVADNSIGRPASAVITVEIVYPPSVRPLQDKAFITAKEGETITLTCIATGSPVPVITWKRAGRHYDSSKENAFIIHDAQKSNSGDYECIADNGIGDPVSAVITVEILYPPSVRPLQDKASITAKEGENVTLACDVVGNPVPKITWKHAGRHYGSFEENKYIISNVQKSDSGEYECIAHNSIGLPASAVINVEILYPPSVRPLKDEDFITAKEGDSITLTCDASGNPVPHISWKRAGRHYHSPEENSYIISNAQKSDSGEYECIAYNSVGHPASAVITVQIISTGKQVKGVSSSSCSTFNLNLLFVLIILNIYSY